MKMYRCRYNEAFCKEIEHLFNIYSTEGVSSVGAGPLSFHPRERTRASPVSS